MKKKQLIISLIAVFSLLISCNKNENFEEEMQTSINKKPQIRDKSYLLRLPIKEQVEYANQHLLNLGIIF